MRRLSPFERLVLFLMSYLVIPGFGLYLAVTHPAAYMIPLITAMLGVPIVGPGRGGSAGSEQPELDESVEDEDQPPWPKWVER